jgi:hypothetical protein
LIENPHRLAGRLLKVFSPETLETPMTFLTLSIAAIALASPQPVCPLPSGALSMQRFFTNADLERMAACRYQTGAESRSQTATREADAPRDRRPTRAKAAESAGPYAAEEDWRAQWRAIDQKTRRLRREAQELRQEAGDAPREPRKRPTGRRSPSLLNAKALALEAEARELEDEFQDRARRAGALPGWLRPRTR